MRSLYDAIKALISLKPQSDSGGIAVDGGSVDTQGYSTAALNAYVVKASGAPTAASTAVKLQESADNSTWADALDNTGTVIGATVDVHAADGEVYARIEGLGLNRKRYLRVVETTTFTGGTTPAVLVTAEILLGNAYQKPVNTAVSNT